MKPAFSRRPGYLYIINYRQVKELPVGHIPKGLSVHFPVDQLCTDAGLHLLPVPQTVQVNVLKIMAVADDLLVNILSHAACIRLPGLISLIIPLQIDTYPSLPSGLRRRNGRAHGSVILPVFRQFHSEGLSHFFLHFP